MAEEQELGDWLAENLMEWKRLTAHSWETKTGWHMGSDWLTTTGDGMVALLMAIAIPPDGWYFVLGDGIESSRDGPKDLPLAVARAAKAALEASKSSAGAPGP